MVKHFSWHQLGDTFKLYIRDLSGINTNPWRIKRFKSLGKVKKRTDQGRPQVNKQTVQAVILYCSQHLWSFLKTAVADLGIPHPTIKNFLKMAAHMLSYKIKRVHHSQLQDYGEGVAFSQLFMDNRLSDSGPLRQIIFSNECILHCSRSANTQTTCIWGTKQPKKIQQHELHCKIVAGWYAVLPKGMIGPY